MKLIMMAISYFIISLHSASAADMTSAEIPSRSLITTDSMIAKTLKRTDQSIVKTERVYGGYLVEVNGNIIILDNLENPECFSYINYAEGDNIVQEVTADSIYLSGCSY